MSGHGLGGAEGDGEFTSPMVEVATSLHEMFLVWMAGGFTEEQALRLVALGIHLNGREQ